MHPNIIISMVAGRRVELVEPLDMLGTCLSRHVPPEAESIEATSTDVANILEKVDA